MQRALPSLILLSLLSLGSLFFRLGSLPLSGADEPRYARISQEMHDRGSWVTPTLEGRPWLEKPPLYYWITIPFYAVFQHAETAARIGPAICAFIAGLAVFWMGTLLRSRLAGMLSATVLLTGIGFIGFGRSASTDMPFTCCFTLAMAIFLAAVKRDYGAGVLPAYVFLGLAVLGKGPVAIILAAGIGIFFWLLNERGALLRRWQVVPGVVVAAVISVPWFWLVFKQNGYAFLATFFINHNLARFVTDIHHHSQPFYYYLPVLLLLIFPWSGWLPVLWESPMEGLRRWRQWDPGMLFLGCWFLVPILFFSLSGSKLAGYILPSIPPLAVILGIAISGRIEEAAPQRKLRASMWLHLAFSAAIALAALIYFNKEYGGRWGVGLLLALVILVPAAFAFGFRNNWKRAFAATALQGLILVVAIAQFAFPVLGAYHSTKQIAQQALSLQRPGEPIATYRFFHHSLHYYTGYRIAAELGDKASLLQFVEAHPGSLVITKQEGLKEIMGSNEFSIALLGKQGDFRLLRLSPIPGF